MELRMECSPVVDVKRDGPATIYTQDFSRHIDLTMVDKNKGVVSCPLLKSGLCQGRHDCIVNEIDKHTTVVEAQNVQIVPRG